MNEEDVGTLRLLYEGGIPAIVLLSKADLLTEEDLHRVTGYIHEQLQAELGLAMNVHPVSSFPHYAALLDQFFEQELLPRFNQARSLRNASVARKIGVLRGSLVAAIETTLDQTKRRGQELPQDVHDLEEQLRLVTGEVGEQRTVLNHAFFELGETPERVLNEVADTTLTWMKTHSDAHVGVAPRRCLEVR